MTVNEPVLVGIRTTATRNMTAKRRRTWNVRFDRFIEYLVNAGVLAPPPPAEPVAPDAMSHLRAEYESWLRHQRGLSEVTIGRHLCFLKRFMTFRFGEVVGNLDDITSGDIIAFLSQPTSGTRFRLALLRMHREGVIALPPARKRPGPRKPIALSPETDPPSLFEPPTSLEAVRPLCIEPVVSRAEGRLWNAFVARYHYLGHHPLPGAQMRYFVRATNGEPLAVLGFGAAAWKTAPRDLAVCRTHSGPRQARRAPPICPAGEERLAQTLAEELETNPLPVGNRRPVRPRHRKLTINQGATREPNVYTRAAEETSCVHSPDVRRARRAAASSAPAPRCGARTSSPSPARSSGFGQSPGRSNPRQSAAAGPLVLSAWTTPCSPPRCPPRKPRRVPRRTVVPRRSAPGLRPLAPFRCAPQK